MSTNSRNVVIPSILQPKEAPSPEAASREASSIAGNRVTTATATSTAKRVAFRRSSAQPSSSASKSGRAQAGAPSLTVSNTSSKKGIVKKTRKNSKNNRPNSMNKGTIRLSKLTAPSFDVTSPSAVDKRADAKSVPLAYKKIMIR